MRRTHLQEAVEFIRGITFNPDELIAPDAPGAVVCMRTKNIQSDLDESDLIAVPRSLVRSEEKFLRPGDILLSSANSWELVGKSVAVPKLCYAATAGGFISIVRPKHGVHHRYLYHWLTQPGVQHTIRHCGRQTTNISNLDVGRFLELEIPHPPMDEQERIAAILDKADAIRRKRRLALAEIDDLLRSAYQSLVSVRHPNFMKWKPKTFEELAAQHKGSMRTGPFGSDLRHSEFVDVGIAVLGIDNAVSNRFAWGGRRYITPEKYEGLRRYRAYPGDVIVTIMGTTGRSAVVPDDIPEAITTKHLATITLDRHLALPEFVAFAIHSDPRIVSQIARANKGAIMDGLNLGIIKRLEIALPPIEDQERFARVYRKLNAHKARLEMPEVNGDELFNSLAQRAFRGELSCD